MTVSPSSSSKGEGEWVSWATLGRPHGLRGEIRISLNNPDTEHLDAVEVVRVTTERGVSEFRLEAIRGAANARIAKLKGVDSREQADALRNADVLVPRSVFPPLAEGEFYAFELEGLAALDPGGTKIGEVETLTSFGAGDILVVRIGGTVEFVPFAEPYVGDVDLEGGTVTVDLTDLRG